MQTSKRIVILGGGLAGLSAAYKLKKGLGAEGVVLLEKADKVGGTAQTVTVGKYSFDLTGHALHLCSADAERFIFEELGLGAKLNKVDRRAVIYTEGEFVPYPFQYNLSYLEDEKRDFCIIEFLKARYGENPASLGSRSFLQYCYSSLGKGISDLFMIPYNRKVWSIDLSNLSIEWMGRYVPSPDFDRILEGAFRRKTMDDAGYNVTFFYPESRGIELLPNSIYEHIRDIVFLSHPATTIELERKMVSFGDISFEYEYLISTIPLPIFLRLSGLPEYADGLKWAVVRVFFVAVPTEAAPQYTWIYLPDASKKIYRIGNFSLFSSSLSVDGKDVMWMECSASQDEVDSLPTFDEILGELRDLCMFDTSSAEFIARVDINPAYVIYDLPWKTHLELIRRMLQPQGVTLAGRYGNWKYDTMEGAILDGLNAAETVIRLIKRDG